MIKKLFLSALLLVCLFGTAHSQSTSCWQFSTTTGAWVNTCTTGSTSPVYVSVGKKVTFLNTLTLQGVDNQTLSLINLPQGLNNLGTAALQPASAFQPAGAGANLSIYYGSAITLVSSGAIGPLNIGAGYSFQSGMLLTISYVSNGLVYMYGYVTSYTGGNLSFTVTQSSGAIQSYTGWNISISGPPGATGATGTSSAAPVGSSEMYFGPNLPANYLWASGGGYTACVSSSTYSGLYTALGGSSNPWSSAYGCGAGTFAIPNMSGRFPIGTGQGATAYNGGGGTNRSLGQQSNGDPNSGATYYGSETHTQTQSEVAPHNHGVPATGGVGGATTVVASASTESAAENINTQLNAGGNPMNIMNPWLAVNYIIKYQ